MTAEIPILTCWDGEAFRPVSAMWAKRADRDYVVGETYRIAPVEDRSMRSHNHFFAAVTEAWRNLPEHLADNFPTPEHLRKFALIKAGYCDERSVVCASKAEAQRMASFVRPCDDFAVVTAREAVVTIYTAKSQSTRAMGKADFQASKDAVLDTLAEMIAVERRTLDKNAGQAA